MTTGTDQTPGEWTWSGTAGDGLIATPFTLTWGAFPVIITDAAATVRRQPRRTAEVVLELSCDVASNVVTVGSGDVMPNQPGVWFWDLQIEGTVDGDPIGPLTFVAGTFTIERDVTNP